MLYLSIVLIFIGILIFVYSLIIDAKKRREGTASQSPDACAEAMKNKRKHTGYRGVVTDFDNLSPGDKKESSLRENNQKHAGGKHEAVKVTGKNGTGQGKAGPASSKMPAVLYEDSSGIVDYNTEGGAIDSTLDGYRNIKRVGGGELSVEKGGINFSLGRKLYRYDFHRIRDIKTGAKHLALFLHGTDAVKLFIFDAETEGIAAMSSAYRDYARSTEQHV
jgi:LAS superfamily LD-carboxypeptidase LdcB